MRFVAVIPVDSGHRHVHQDDVIGRALQRRDRFGPVRGQLDRVAAVLEQMRDEHLVDRVVLGDEDPQRAFGRIGGPDPLGVVRGGRGPRGVEAQREPEPAAAPRRAFDADRPAHQLHKLLRDRKAEAGTAELARGGAVRLAEALKEPVERLGRDADAGVADLDTQLARAVPADRMVERDAHASVRRELDGVADDVRQHLAEPGRVADHLLRQVRRRFDLDRQPLAFRSFREQATTWSKTLRGSNGAASISTAPASSRQ
jgi:hypothetical protein